MLLNGTGIIGGGKGGTSSSLLLHYSDLPSSPQLKYSRSLLHFVVSISSLSTKIQ